MTISGLGDIHDSFEVGPDVTPGHYSFMLVSPRQDQNLHSLDTNFEVERNPYPLCMIPKFSDARKLCCKLPKIIQRGQTLGYFIKKMQME